MTFEERDQLTRFLQLLTQAQAGPKDPEAEALIRDATMRQPDAPYLLVQRVLQLEHALKDAMRDAMRDASQKPSFVGDANSWGRAPVASQPAPSPAPIPMQQVPAAAPQPSAWGSGLLGTVAMTAGGVVAGSLLAQGIGSLFGHHNNPSADHAAIPPGGGTLVDTDYGASNQDDGGYVADDFDTGGDSGDVG
jgi:hypothetical protein